MKYLHTRFHYMIITLSFMIGMFAFALGKPFYFMHVDKQQLHLKILIKSIFFVSHSFQNSS